MGVFRSPRVVGTALAAVLGVALPAVGHAVRTPATPAATRSVAGQAIVRFDPGASPALRAAARSAAGARLLDRIEALDAELVRVPHVEPALRALRALPGVTSAEPNMTGTLQAAPPPSRANDPLLAGLGPTFADRQWYLQRINAPYAWTVWPQTYYSARTKPRNPIKVAVLDTAVDVAHRDWQNAGGEATRASLGGQLALADAKSFVPSSKIDGPSRWHGTFVAGLIAAATDNSTDIAGIAYQSQLMPVTVAQGNGALDAWTVSKGLTWASDRGARVINVSLTVHGTSNQVETLRAAVNRAVARGALVVASVGSADSDDAEYPAGFAAENPGVLAVGATDVFDRLACSKKARHLSLLAPADMIWSLDPQNRADVNDHVARRENCFSSYSAAIVSGVATLVADKFRGEKPAQIARRILSGADDLGAPGRDDETGAGRVNAERALWDKPGPGMQWKTIPTGGRGKVTLVAQAASAAGVSAAEILVDGRQRGKGSPMRAADGRYGSRTESVAVTLDTANMSEGPHEVHVRARDARGAWGPAATSVLIVDRSPPNVPAPVTFPANTRPVVNPDDPPAAIHFTVEDTWSRTLRVKIDVIDAAFTSVAMLQFPALPANATYKLPWKMVEKAHGGPLLPGAYRVIVNARDQAGYEDYGDGPIVVGATPRLVPSPGSTSSNLPGGGVSTQLPTALPTPTPTAPPSASPSAAPSVAPPGLPTASPSPSGRAVSRPRRPS